MLFPWPAWSTETWIVTCFAAKHWKFDIRTDMIVSICWTSTQWLKRLSTRKPCKTMQKVLQARSQNWLIFCVYCISGCTIFKYGMIGVQVPFLCVYERETIFTMAVIEGRNFLKFFHVSDKWVAGGRTEWFNFDYTYKPERLRLFTSRDRVLTEGKLNAFLEARKILHF